MPLTKIDLQNALKQQNVELGKFLEKKVIAPIFGLKKDVSGLKKDIKEVKHEVSNINRRIDASFTQADRHSDKLKDHEKRITKLEQTSPATV